MSPLNQKRLIVGSVFGGLILSLSLVHALVPAKSVVEQPEKTDSELLYERVKKEYDESPEGRWCAAGHC